VEGVSYNTHNTMKNNTMKKNGKLFGKIHVLDILVILLVIIVALTAFSRLSGNDIVSFSSSEDYKIKYSVLTYEYNESYFESARVGDLLAEDKRYLDGKITNVEIVDKVVTFMDNEGELVTGAHPDLKRALITVEATVEYKNSVYKLGKQEIREGKPNFVITERCNLSGIITDFQVIE
jgi:hypothetical protein